MIFVQRIDFLRYQFIFRNFFCGISINLKTILKSYISSDDDPRSKLVVNNQK